MKDYNNNIVPADNDKATETRLQVADECLGDLIDWLQTGGGQVAIFDGNNVTEARRKQIHDKLLDNDIHVTSSLKRIQHSCINTTLIATIFGVYL